jgi:hypothetical protein
MRCKTTRAFSSVITALSGHYFFGFFVSPFLRAWAKSEAATDLTFLGAPLLLSILEAQDASFFEVVTFCPFFLFGSSYLRTPRRAPTRIALQTRPAPQQGEIPAVGAGFAFEALGLGFGALFGGERAGFGAGLGGAGRPGEVVEGVGRRGGALRFQRGAALDEAVGAGREGGYAGRRSAAPAFRGEGGGGSGGAVQ